MLAVKSVRQNYPLPPEIHGLLETFRRMVNDSISIGLANDASSLRKLSLLSYNQLASYDIPSYYKLCAISRAAGKIPENNIFAAGFTFNIQPQRPTLLRRNTLSYRKEDNRPHSEKRPSDEHTTILGSIT